MADSGKTARKPKPPTRKELAERRQAVEESAKRGDELARYVAWLAKTLDVKL